MVGRETKAVAQMWEDLQTTDIDVAHTKAEKKDVNHLLMTLCFGKNYPLGVAISGQSKKIKDDTEKTAADWCWFFIKKLQVLKMAKIVYPDEWADPGSSIFQYSVDGVHFNILEPMHLLYNKNTKYYDHKCNRASLAFEIAVSMW